MVDVATRRSYPPGDTGDGEMAAREVVLSGVVVVWCLFGYFRMGDYAEQGGATPSNSKQLQATPSKTKESDMEL